MANRESALKQLECPGLLDTAYSDNDNFENLYQSNEKNTKGKHPLTDSVIHDRNDFMCTPKPDIYSYGPQKQANLPNQRKEYTCEQSGQNTIDNSKYDTYFSEDGKIVKVVSDGSGKAFLIKKDKSELILKLTNKELLDRAHWVFGEGGGAFADRYAYTIENLRQSGRSGYGPTPFSSEKEMYERTQTHQLSSGKIVTLYPEYFNPGVNAHGREFAKARKRCSELMKDAKMVDTIRAVIHSITDNSGNEGYNNWRGGGDTLYSESEKNAYKEVENVKDEEIKTKKDKKGKERIIGYIKKEIHHFWERTNTGKYRRHTFYKIWRQKV